MRKNIILMGPTGRLGRVCKRALYPFGTLTVDVIRGGIIRFNDQSTYSLEDAGCLEGNWVVIDASVDYSSLEAFLSWESRKRKFVQQLYNDGKLEAYVAFSSGIVEFDPGFIDDEFKKEYRAAKVTLEKFATSLNVPIYCPRIFTLIGPETWAYGKIAWVQVAKQVIEQGFAMVAYPDEIKSWVAESTIEAQIRDFVSGKHTKKSEILTPLDGTFTLRDIVNIVSFQFGMSSRLELIVMKSWLDVDYKSTMPHTMDLQKLTEVLMEVFLTSQHSYQLVTKESSV